MIERMPKSVPFCPSFSGKSMMNSIRHCETFAKSRGNPQDLRAKRSNHPFDFVWIALIYLWKLRNDDSQNFCAKLSISIRPKTTAR